MTATYNAQVNGHGCLPREFYLPYLALGSQFATQHYMLLPLRLIVSPFLISAYGV